MALLLLRATRRPLVAPLASLYRPTRCALLQSFSAFSTAPTRGGASKAVKQRTLSHAEKLALLAPTLTAFHARHGHFIMYNGFEVPTDDDADGSLDFPPYPEAHTQTLQALDDIGFPVDVDWEQYVWQHQRLPALRVYRELHGDLLVPQSFVVPTGDARWPIETWGFKLGDYASMLRSARHRLLTQTQRDMLAELGVSWPLNDLPLVDRLSLLAPTLKAFHAGHGHYIMHTNFVVPMEDDTDVSPHRPPYPETARGLKFGTTLHRLLVSDQSRHRHSKVVEQLAEIGFPVHVDWEQHVWTHQRLPAFRVYAELHGGCLVPQSFVVPIGDPTWPKETWGFKLGSYASSFRHSGHRFLTREQLSALAELGLSWALNDLPLAKRLPLVAPTLRAFYARHGHFIMHANFSIPNENDSAIYPHLPPYPDAAFGLRLGSTLHRLLVRAQSRQKHSRVLHELKEIGFPVDIDWKNYVFERQRLAALRVYVEIYGDCRRAQVVCRANW